MNILLIYPELPFSFWSFPQAIRFSTAKALYAPLGPITVAALLPKEWDIKFVDLNVREVTEKEWQWADIIMISGMIVQRKSFQPLIEEAKKRAKVTVAGGPYPTLMADELITIGCDIVVCGEAENNITSLVDAIQSRKSGQVIRNNEKPDLNNTPLPRYDLINLDDYYHFLIQTTRGCPFSCEFCDIAGLYGKQPRFKSPDQVIAELEYLYQLGARGHITIADDNFIANKKNAKAICQELIKWNRKRHQPFGFTTQASVNLGQDMEMIDLLTAANFGDIFIGIESPDEDILTANEKHQNVINPLVESIENIKRNGLSIIGSFIIGFDNEKKGAGKRICDFVDQTSIPIIMPNILSAPPGTRLEERLQKEDRLFDKLIALNTSETYFNLPNFIPSRPLEEIMEEFIEMWEYLYNPSRFLERTYKFCLGIRPTRKAIAAKNGTPHEDNPAKTTSPPLKRQLCELVTFFHHAWLHGVIAPHRVQFWKQLKGMQKQNPSRLKKYIVHCISGDSYLQMSKTIRHDIHCLLAEQDKRK
ncbi:Fe-S oxidoreductase [Desulfocapsa sulfexigens DSM 10523]|uniref:Fe-S oxidoreductase n=1 Tax=Desulfocapsa sulfexigens (strain DSM 10523 / SB164P1) TaxID=1167006 RepID=M1PQ75_DESSD|nr:B12-binding domain-containing radical SAM protein [Desulfocapsa sulfexigens]AGF78531.1 Fe-S oxidoreductase [Desulfocapsa sulfexigens DSM 10523]